MKQLVCEGPCNPLLPAIDARIKRGEIVSYSRVRYTPHRMSISDVIYACTVCGHHRQFGGNGIDVRGLAIMNAEVRDNR